MELTELSLGDQVQIFYQGNFYYGQVDETELVFTENDSIDDSLHIRFIGEKPTNCGVRMIADTSVGINPLDYGRSQLRPMTQAMTFVLLNGSTAEFRLCDKFVYPLNPNTSNKQKEDCRRELILHKIRTAKDIGFVRNKRMLLIENITVDKGHLAFTVDGESQRVPLAKCGCFYSLGDLPEGYVIYGEPAKEILDAQREAEKHGLPNHFIELFQEDGTLNLSTSHLREWAMALYYNPELLEQLAFQAIAEGITGDANGRLQ